MFPARLCKGSRAATDCTDCLKRNAARGHGNLRAGLQFHGCRSRLGRRRWIPRNRVAMAPSCLDQRQGPFVPRRRGLVGHGPQLRMLARRSRPSKPGSRAATDCTDWLKRNATRGHENLRARLQFHGCDSSLDEDAPAGGQPRCPKGSWALIPGPSGPRGFGKLPYLHVTNVVPPHPRHPGLPGGGLGAA